MILKLIIKLYTWWRVAIIERPVAGPVTTGGAAALATASQNATPTHIYILDLIVKYGGYVAFFIALATGICALINQIMQYKINKKKLKE